MDADATEEEQKLIEDGRALFCSELVVKAYKTCGILKQTDEACSNFLPADLSTAKDRLDLVDGARLGPEKLILTRTMIKGQEPEPEKDDDEDDDK